MWRGLVASLLALVFLLSSHDSADMQAKPEFRLGFQALATMIPQIVGEPLDDEQHNPLNGDAFQRTTKGLMVWRKADNWTAFTDGFRTWINGPLGIQERYNDERFDWEIEPVAQPPTSTPMPKPEAVVGPTPDPPHPTATAVQTAAGVRSAEPAGEWVTSTSPGTKYYTTRSNSYWKSWSPNNRIWFATEAELLSCYPGRIRK